MSCPVKKVFCVCICLGVLGALGNGCVVLPKLRKKAVLLKADAQ